MFPAALEAVRTVADEPLAVAGYSVPRGTSVFVAIAAIHRDPALFPQPSEFRPERFLDRTFARREFLPFGFGNRRCLGAALAGYELRIVLATVLGEAALEPAAPPARLLRYNLGAAPDTGVPVTAVGRAAGSSRR